jgi:predicted Zn-dependent protease
MASPAGRWWCSTPRRINAFALPGGKIGVYSGLLKVAKNQDQLATVIGHELTHVLAQHSNERLSRDQLTGIGLAVADAAIGSSDSLGALPPWPPWASGSRWG